MTGNSWPSGDRSRFVRWWLPAIAWAVIILVGTSLPRVPGPDVDNADKLAHLIAYFVLGALVARAFRGGTKLDRAQWAGLTVVAGSLYGLLDELHQIPLPERSCSAGDLVADVAGVALGVVMIMLLGLRRDGTDPRH